MARSSTQPPRARQEELILDSSALIAASRRNAEVRAHIDEAIEGGLPVWVPSVVVAETVRGNGPRDAAVNHILKLVDAVLPATESTGRLAGEMLGRSGSDATIDALVAATAVERGAATILTSDVKDMRRLVPRGSAVRILAL